MSSFFTSLVSCVNYDEDITSLNESVSLLEEENQKQQLLISNLQTQIDEIKKQQEQDRISAEGYIQNALSLIIQLTSIIDDLSSQFINQVANLAAIEATVENLEENVNSLQSQVELIDSTGDISEINELLENLQNSIDDNSQSILNTISRISNLEIDSQKYDSDIIGCYEIDNYDNEVSIKFLENGIGYVDYFEGVDYSIQVFTWEKEETGIKLIFGDIIELVVIGTTYRGYLFEGEHIVEIEKIEKDDVLYNTISLAIFVGYPTPFNNEFDFFTFIDCQWFYPD